ncbi:MAG: hypothetical protein KBE23_16155 [Chloroflexi bacterium]|nr:hypothetical protein [Chloroflexota bacterium]
MSFYSPLLFVTAVALAIILLTVRQLRAVVATPSAYSAFSASLKRSMPSGVCK